MAKTYTVLRDLTESKLRDSSNTIFSTAEIDDDFITALREIARYKKHIVRVIYQVESRTGTCDADSANNLTDIAKSQFVSATDVGKTIYNTDDKTWAEIVSVTSTSVVALSSDIMDDGEAYEMYNKGCYNSKQINIEDIEDDVGDNRGIVRLEYPIGIERNVDSVVNNIVTIGIDFIPADTSATNAKKDVYVWFSKRHKISQLTDLAGAVDLVVGYSAGDTSMVIDALGSTQIIEEDQEFTIANRREIYTVTAEVTTSANEATVTFYPGLESDIDNDTVVNFVLSTLSRRLETVFVDYVVALAQENEAVIHLPSISTGGTGTWERYLAARTLRMDRVRKELESMAEPEIARVLPQSDYVPRSFFTRPLNE